MSLITLLPLVLALISVLVFAFFALTHQSLAQSLCVQKATQMQAELGRTLRNLLALNRTAQELRHQRAAADRDLATAVESGFPPAIAAAQIRQDAVIAAQLAFRARQTALLLEAEGIRQRFERELHHGLTQLRVPALAAPRFYPRALAVRPTPEASLSPDYVTVSGFAERQQALFRFIVNLNPTPLPFLDDLQRRQFIHHAECVVTLKAEGTKWYPEIKAASASSKWP